MSRVNRDSALQSFDLPVEFEDLTGLLDTDIRAMVSVVSQRAAERLLLTRRETIQLRRTLWNRLVKAVNESVSPLTAEHR